MNPSLRLLFIGGTALMSCLFADFASAQPNPPQPPAGPAAVPPPPAGAAYDRQQQLPETRGTVQRFTLTPRGDLDGFVLADGTDVHVPPHLSTRLAAAVRPGDTVSVRGYRSAGVPLVVAAAVTDSATNQTVIDQGPPPPGFGPPPPPPGVAPPGSQQMSLTGRVQTSLYGPASDLNGAVLDDGTIVRLPPPVAYRWASLLAPGQTIAVQGWGLTTAYGRVVDAQTVGPAAAQLTSAAPPPTVGSGIASPPPAVGPAWPPQPPGR